MAAEPIMLVFCAPSGAGKTTLKEHLLAAMPKLTFSVSHTTREPRPGEISGRDYHFVDREAFMRSVEAGEFAEWAEVHGNCYGTRISELQRVREQGFDGLVFDVDHQGARQLKAQWPQAVGIYILPPSFHELRRRLQERASDATAVIEKRLSNAYDEVSHYGFFDYLVVNDTLDEAKVAVVSIAQAEMMRRWRQAPRAEAVLRSHEALKQV